VNASVFARVNPENKLDLIDLHQAAGSIVAMTGDGVKRRTGAEEGRHRRRHGATRNPGRPRGVGHDPQRRQLREYLSRRQRGRTIFRNIRKFVLYLMSCNLSELLTILIAALLSFPLPLLPLQILFLNVVDRCLPGVCTRGL